jgi:hypothetical protein
MLLSQAEVVRFGKLFPLGPKKSCPFWKTRTERKDTKIPYNANISNLKKN